MVVDEPEENNVDKMPEIVEHPATPQIEKDEGNDDIVPIKSPDGIRKEESKFLLIFSLFSKVPKFCNLPSHYLYTSCLHKGYSISSKGYSISILKKSLAYCSTL